MPQLIGAQGGTGVKFFLHPDKVSGATGSNVLVSGLIDVLLVA